MIYYPLIKPIIYAYKPFIVIIIYYIMSMSYYIYMDHKDVDTLPGVFPGSR